jgi:hypothetical protein
MTTTVRSPERTPLRSWWRLWAASVAVRLLLAMQIGMALLHYLRVPDQIVGLDRIHESVRPVRVLRLHAVLQDTSVTPIVWSWFVILTALAFALWLWIAYSQLDQPGDERRYRRAWSIVGWFVPFGNLYVPKRIVDDIVVAQRRHDARAAEAADLRMWVNAWWASWVLTAIVTYFACEMAYGATTVIDAQNGVLALAVCDAAVLVAACLAWISVGRITRAQRELALRRSTRREQ